VSQLKQNSLNNLSMDRFKGIDDDIVVEVMLVRDNVWRFLAALQKKMVVGRAGRSTPIGSTAAPQGSPSSLDNYFPFTRF
jgi:hypothetical protein